MLFHEVPKFHYVWHIILQSLIANPRFNWTYPDEDFMRILKARFGRVSVERTLCGQGLLNLYQAHAEIQGVAAALDFVHSGQWERAEATLLLLLCAAEQSSLDRGRWSLAWLLTRAHVL